MIKTLRSLFINKTLVVLSFFLSISAFTFSQTYTMCSGAANNSTCTGTFYDSGGNGGNYTNSENCTKTFTSTGGNHLVCHFTSFTLESNYDYLKVYDGPNTGSALLGTFSGSTVPSDLISTGTSLTFVFTSDGSVVYAGWAANLSCSLSPNVQDCMGAIPLCFSTYSTSISYVGTGNITPEIPTSGSCAGNGNCLASGERNDVWYTFTVASSGLLDFRILPNSSGDDYDWAVYNLTNNNCSDIYNNNSAVQTSCNYAVADATNFGITGAHSPTGSSNCQDASTQLWNSSIPVTAGQTYVLNVSNFSATADGYTIDFSNTTASIIDNIAPHLSSVITPIPCGSNTVTIKFSENLQCSSVSASDFVLTGPGGPYTVSNVTGPGCSLGASQEDKFTLTVSPAMLTSGTYSVGTSSSCTLTDLCGNINPSSNLLTFTIVGVSASISGQTNSTCGLSNGSTTALGSGGTGPYTYAWSNSGSTNIISSLAAGTYTCTVSDAYGCQSTTSSTLTTTAAAVAPTSTSADRSGFCSDDAGNITLTASGGSGTTLNWTSGSCGGTAEGTGASLTIPSPTSTTTYYASWTNTCGASTCSNVTVTVSPIAVAPTLVTIDRNNFCSDDAGNIQLSATGGSGTTLTWYTGSCGGSSIGTGTPLTISSPTSSTTYYAGWTNGCGSSTCSNSAVTVNPSPTASAGSDQTIPTGTSTSLLATASGGTGPYDYSWAPTGSLITSNVPNPTTTNLGTTTVFTVTVTDQASGCNSTDQVTVTVSGPPLSVTTTATPNTICSGQSSQLLALPSGGSGTYTYSWSSSPAGFSSTISNPVVSPALTTTYTVTVNDGFNNATSAVTVTVNASPGIYNVTGGGAFCSGGTGIIIGLDGSESGVSYQLLLNGSNQGSAVAGSGSPIGFGSQTSAGTYTVIATNTISLCSANMNGNAVVNVNTSPLANAGSDATIPNGTSTSLSGNASAGTGPYTYAWTPAGSLVNAAIQNPTTVNLSSTTTFILTVTDQATGCTGTNQVTITISGAPLSVSTSATPNTICSGQSSQLLASPIGGSGVYSYNWTSNPAGFNSFIANPIVSPATTTIYSVTVNDGFNNATSSVTVTVNPTPTIYNITGGGSYCSGGTGVIIGLDDSENGVNYQLLLNGSNQGSPVAGTGSPISFGTQTSSGTYTVVATNAVSSCSSNMNGSASITMNTSPTANAGSDISIPNGTNTILNGSTSGGTGPYAYSWSPAGSLINANVQNTTTTNLAVSTVYTLTVTDQATGCSGTDQVTVTITGGPLSVNTSATPNSLCLGSTSQISALAGGGSGSYSYSWSSVPAGFSSAAPTIIVSPAVSTVYTVNVNDGFNTATSSVSITVNPVPTASAGSDVSICNGSSTTLNATGGISYTWSPGTGLSATNIFNPVASPTASTTYTVIAYNSFGCSASDAIAITILTASPANAGSDVAICNGSSAYLNASGGTSFNWSPATGLSSTTISNPVATPSNTITYNVVVTDINGCTNTDAVVVTVNPSVAANAGADVSICSGSSTPLNAIGGTSYSWGPSYGLNSTSIANPTANPLTSTTYIVTVTNASGCSGTDAVTVTVNPSVSAIASQDIAICAGSTTGLFASGGSTYLWSPSSGLSAVNIPNPNANPVSTTTYTVVVSNASGCSASDQVVVTVNPLPLADAGNPQSICNHQIATLTASGGVNYLWNNNTSGAIIHVSPNTTTTYVVTVSNAAGCSASDNVSISVLPFEPPTITSSGSIGFCYGDPVNVTLDAGNGYSSYLWSNSSNSQTINVTAPGTFFVIGSYSNGCSDTSNIVHVQSFPLVAAPVILASGPTSFCEGDAISVNLYTNTTYYSYQWSSGSYTPTIHVTHPGNYGVTVSDANGCIATALLPMPVVMVPKPVAYMNYSINGLYSEFFNYSLNDSSYAWNFGDGTNSTIENPVHSFLTPGVYTVTLVVSNMCGSDSTTVLITVVSGAGIDESSIIQNLVVYPIPTQNLLTISFDNNENNSILLTVTDILGRVIMSEDAGKVSGKFFKQISLESLATGVYNLQISTENGSVFRKIIVSK